MSKKGRSGRFEPLGQAAQRFLEKRMGNRLASYEAVRVWPDAVGSDIASRTVALGIKSGILHILVSNKVWLTQLTILKRQLIEKVNARLGEEMVKDIKFVEKRTEIPGARSREPEPKPKE